MLVLLDGSELKTNLTRIAQDVFSMMVNLELSPVQHNAQLMEPVGAMLSFRAPINKVLTLECDATLASVLTKQLMALESQPTSKDDSVRDSVGELTNMIGGNFKTLLAECESLDTTPSFLPLSAMRHAEVEKPLAEVWLGSAHGNLRLSLRAETLAGFGLIVSSEGSARSSIMDRSIRKQVA